MTTSSRTQAVRYNFTAVGAFVGAVLGFLGGLIEGDDPVFAATVVLAYGALFGAVIGGVADDAVQLPLRGRRRFSR